MNFDSKHLRFRPTARSRSIFKQSRIRYEQFSRRALFASFLYQTAPQIHSSVALGTFTRMAPRMIGWIYSVARLATVVIRGRQKFWEGAKTIVGCSNRFRVVTDVGYDDFMQWERPLGVARVPSRLAATRRAPRAAGGGHPAHSRQDARGLSGRGGRPRTVRSARRTGRGSSSSATA